MESSAETAVANPTFADPPEDENTEARHYAQTLSVEDVYEKSSAHIWYPRFAYPSERSMVWVKFTCKSRRGWSGESQLSQLLVEGEMQRRAWEWVRTERLAGRCNPDIYVPEVYKAFRKGNRAFIVMQLLDARVLSQCSDYPAHRYYDLIADGIRLLCRMPVPVDAIPGPYTKDPKLWGYRRICHPIFKDHEARSVYSNIHELDAHINRVIGLSPPGTHPPMVSLEKELVFCYCDFNPENFLFTTHADGCLRLYVVDFGHASFLPISFLAYALFIEAQQYTTHSPLVRAIGHMLPTGNLEAMMYARYMFTISQPKIGLIEENVEDRGKCSL
ncbi:hypothetical protein VTK56DRAFT_4385 [Thermocarpiscus australiensis]